MRQHSKRELRQFGLMVGGVFLLIGLWPFLWRGTLPRYWALAPGGLLVMLGLLFPGGLMLPHRGWMALGHALGWLNTRIILGVVFYALITPMGLFMRLLGKDPLRLRSPGDCHSYRINRVRREAIHMRHLF